MTNDWLIAGLLVAINPAVCAHPAVAAMASVTKYQHRAYNRLWIIKQTTTKRVICTDTMVRVNIEKKHNIIFGDRIAA